MKPKMRKWSFASRFIVMLLLVVSCNRSNAIGDYQSAGDLFKNCPGECGEAMACDGQLVKVWGYLDTHNIFDGSQGDEVERFFIAEKLDPQGFGDGQVIEVHLLQGKDNTSLFEQFTAVQEPQKIFVTGTLKGYDAPTNLTCEKMLILEVEDASQVTLE